MDPQDLRQIEVYCAALFETSSTPLQREEAHRVLLPLLSDPSKIYQLQQVLIKSNNSHAIVFAAQVFFFFF